MELTNDSNNMIQPENIAELVAHTFRVDEQDLYRRGQHQPLCFARQVAMTLTYRFTMNSTLSRTGLIYGGLHHSSVSHAIYTVAKLRKENKQIDKAITNIETKCKTIITKLIESRS